MEESQYYDEISLRELLEVLFREKKWIALIAGSIFLMVTLYTFFVAKPVYESRAYLVVNQVEQVATPYGPYDLPLQDASHYSNLLMNPQTMQLVLNTLNGEAEPENLRSAITAEVVKDTNSFWIRAEGSTPEEAYERAQAAVSAFMETVDVLHGRIIAAHFYNLNLDLRTALLADIEKNQKLLERNRELLDATPRTESWESAFVNRDSFLLWQQNQNSSGSGDFGESAIVSEKPTTAYQRIEQEITSLELQGLQLDSQLRSVNQTLLALEMERAGYSEYDAELNKDALYPERSQIGKNLVSIINPPFVNSIRVSPNTMMNLAVGLVLGLMAGVFAAFLKYYLGDTTSKKTSVSSLRPEFEKRSS